MSGLRQIEIQLPDEFGLNKKIKISSIHIYLNEQLQHINVEYYTIWSHNETVVKEELDTFHLDNSGEYQYLDYWDETSGVIIEAGIREWFNNRT